jgi:lipoate-protein ligase A
MLFDELTEVLDPEPHAAALNMAIDEVLLARATGPTLRVYRWAQPAVSFGYFGKLAEVQAAWPARDLVRRWTGGGIVPHGEDLTYTLIVPRTHPFFHRPVEESYCAIHQHLAALLAEQGREVQVATTAAAKISDACFENPARYDLLGERGKIAGAAQRRTRAGLLHQGSVQPGARAPDFSPHLAPSFARKVSQRPIAEAELADAHKLATAKYATNEWLHRF